MGGGGPPWSPIMYKFFSMKEPVAAMYAGGIFMFLAFSNVFTAHAPLAMYDAPPTPGEEKSGGGHGHH